MSGLHPAVDSASARRPPVPDTGTTSPGAYTSWRATTLGTVTEALEQRCILELAGPVERKRVVDLGSGDGLLTATLAARGALAVGIDIDRSMLCAATARTTGRQERARFVEGRVDTIGAAFIAVAASKPQAVAGSGTADRRRAPGLA